VATGGDQISMPRTADGGFPHRAAGRADPGPDGPGRTVLDHPGPNPVPANRPIGIPPTSPDRSVAAGRSIDEDAEPTSPLPVILPGATAVPRPEPVHTPRGFFEAAQPATPAQAARPASITGSVEPPPSVHYSGGQAPGRPDRPMPEAASAKLEQIKDLYLTAEAIGEDALDKHFDQVSQRQRELIREFFERSGPGTANGS
jgi:hypothetical protein